MLEIGNLLPSQTHSSNYLRFLPAVHPCLRAGSSVCGGIKASAHHYDFPLQSSSYLDRMVHVPHELFVPLNKFQNSLQAAEVL